jgi:hypothetical protein
MCLQLHCSLSSSSLVTLHSKSSDRTTVGSRGAQIPGKRSPRQLNFVWWHLICVSPPNGTCFHVTFLVNQILRQLLDF